MPSAPPVLPARFRWDYKLVQSVSTTSKTNATATGSAYYDGGLAWRFDNVFQRGLSGFSFETLYWDGPMLLTALHTDDGTVDCTAAPVMPLPRTFLANCTSSGTIKADDGEPCDRWLCAWDTGGSVMRSTWDISTVTGVLQRMQVEPGSAFPSSLFVTTSFTQAPVGQWPADFFTPPASIKCPGLAPEILPPPSAPPPGAPFQHPQHPPPPALSPLLPPKAGGGSSYHSLEVAVAVFVCLAVALGAAAALAFYWLARRRRQITHLQQLLATEERVACQGDVAVYRVAP